MQSSLEALSAERLLHCLIYTTATLPRFFFLIRHHIQHHCLCETISFPVVPQDYASDAGEQDGTSRALGLHHDSGESVGQRESSSFFPPSRCCCKRTPNWPLNFFHRFTGTSHDPRHLPLNCHRHEHLIATTHASSLQSSFPL